MKWRDPAAVIVFTLCAAGVARPQSLSPRLVDAITEAFNKVGALKPMPYGATYTLNVGGRPVTADPDYFLRRRNGAEILASGMSDGCGDNALAALTILQQHGFQTYFVDSAQISTQSLESNFAGHAVVAVYDPKAAFWVRVDPTRSQYTFPWSSTDKVFYGIYWIGYRGPLEGYPAHDPESLKRFYRDTLKTIPREVLNQTLFRFQFRLDPSLYDTGGKLRNPNLEQFLNDNGKVLEKHGVHPQNAVAIRLMNGQDNVESRCENGSNGWVCTIGQRSALSLGFISYLEERLATAREKGEPLGMVTANKAAGGWPVWLGVAILIAILAGIATALAIWQRQHFARWGHSVAYWLCQFVGWSWTWLIAYPIARAIRPDIPDFGPRDYLVVASITVGGTVTTDLLRRVMRRRRWLSLSGWRRLWRLCLGAAIAILVQFLITSGVEVIWELAHNQSASLQNWLSNLWFFAFMTTVWLILYVLLTGPRRHRETEVQLQLKIREAELRALEAQVNPHFLFNCLNSIRALVTENPERSQDMLTRLANILRYNLRRDLGHTVPLHSEVEIVGDYLALESARFEDRLHVEMAIDPAAADAPVPPMLLQSLVENALKHGIAPLPSGGELQIRAKVMDEGTLMEVENPGQIAPALESTQLGLANIRERLRILYGGRASFELKSRDGRVAASVLIPKTA